jgi:hypothetical protein
MSRHPNLPRQLGWVDQRADLRKRWAISQVQADCDHSRPALAGITDPTRRPGRTFEQRRFKDSGESIDRLPARLNVAVRWVGGISHCAVALVEHSTVESQR